MAGAKLVLTIKRLSDFFLPYFITMLQDTLDLQSPRTLNGIRESFPLSLIQAWLIAKA